VKPSSFDYVRPKTKAEVLSLLAEDPDESKILAGGQSLVPMMNFRLARPERLIDINDVPDIAGIEERGNRLHIGARTRHIAVQNHAGAGPLARVLRYAATQVGHLPIRTRGTFGGSLAHSDAASEWCLLARLLDAEMTVESLGRGRRTIAAKDFFQSIFTTSMEPDELLVDVSLPMLDASHQTGFAEYARRAGDFAIVAVTTDVKIDHGKVSSARVCLGGVSETPFRSEAAERLLVGADWHSEPATSGIVAEAIEAMAAEISPPSDAHGDAEYRKDLVRALFARSIGQGSSQ
jgi:carbon-monoxide dehydrogenase medium subunit